MEMEGKLKEFTLTDEYFQKTRAKAEELYKNTSAIHCPYLKDKVYFNSKGIEHIEFKNKNRPRSKRDQFLRLKLFYLVPDILKFSHTVQGLWCRKEWERRKKHGVWEKVIKEVIYYEFVAVVGKIRIKVIIKEIVGGQKFFWSIIPFWKMNEVTKERKLYDDDIEKDGNLEDDVE